MQLTQQSVLVSNHTRAIRTFLQHRLAVASAAFLLLAVGASAAAPLIAPAEPNAMNLGERLAGISSSHWLGTDQFGRDVLARLVYGGRISVTIGILSALLALAVGGFIGALAGYLGGVVDTVLMRVTDAMLSIPLFFLLLIATVVFGASVPNLILAIGLTSWMPIARVMRGEVLRTQVQDFVLAARALGVSESRILLRHVVPHSIPVIVVSAMLSAAYAILMESALSYLGLGVRPPTASWGNMLNDAQSLLWDKPSLAVYPGLAICLTVLAFNWLGDGLRNALDPHRGSGLLSW